MKARQSNIELLRIISMLMILCVHFTGATFPLPSKMHINDITSISSVAKILMESFSIIGVNCFVLISGFFGIKPSVKGIVNFIICCLFYSVIIYGIYAIALPAKYSIDDVLSSFAIFSHTDLWFIPAYFALYLISPIINRGLNGITKKNFILILVGLTFINVYLGWFWGGKVNPTGYNTMHLIYIYIIGRFIKVHMSSINLSTFKCVIGYIVSFLLIVASTFFCKSSMAFAYNSPFIIFASAFFFLIFNSFSFTSPNINYIASSAFAVYLIHKMPPVWSDLKNFLISNSENYDLILFPLFWIAFIFMIFTACITIDKLRVIITTPLSKFLSKYIGSFYKLLC